MLSFLAAAAQPASEALDILNKVDQFYSGAWNKLIWVIGLGGAGLLLFITVILVAVQLMLERGRRDSFRLDRERVLADIEKSAADLDNKIADARKDVQRLEADICFNLGHEAQRWGRYVEAACHYAGSAQSELSAGRGETQLEVELQAIVEISQHPKYGREVRNHPFAVEKTEELLHKAEGRTFGEACQRHFETLRQFLAKGPEPAQPEPEPADEDAAQDESEESNDEEGT